MPHIEGYPLLGHDKKKGNILLTHNKRIRQELLAEIDDSPSVSSASICEEAGDCADRVNEEELSPEAKQILRDAKRVA